MLTGRDINILLEDQVIRNATKELKLKFIMTEAEFLTISDHDFLALVFLTPSLQIAAADKGISLREEINLNRKARKLSSGNGMFRTDPVVHAMKYLIKNLPNWEESFINLIRLCMDVVFSKNSHVRDLIYDPDITQFNSPTAYMEIPYVFVQFVSSLFLKADQHLDEKKCIKACEYQEVKKIGARLGLTTVPLFTKFCDTYVVK